MWVKFSEHVQTGIGAHPAYYTRGTGSFPGVKRLGHGVNHLSPSSAMVKERVEPYFYSLSEPSLSPVGCTLPYFKYIYTIQSLMNSLIH